MIIRKLMMAAGGAADSYWINLLGGASSDLVRGVAVDSEDNVIVAGQTASDGAGGNDLLLTKYNLSGTLLWSKTLGGSGSEIGFSVAVDSLDNIIVGGSTDSDGAGATDCLLVKYNSSGTLLWSRTLGSNSAGSERFTSVEVDASDNIFAAGIAVVSGNSSFILAKYNASGALQWDKQISNLAIGGGGVAVDSVGNVLAVGSYSAGSNDLLVVKYNSSGTLLWSKLLGGAAQDFGTDIAVDSLDNIIVGGRTASDGAGGTDCLLAKYNSSGTLLWDKTLGGTGSDIGFWVAIDSLDNIAVCGYTASDGAGSDDLLIAKYNSSGTLLWDKTLGGTGSDLGLGIAIDSLDNIAVCGYTDSDGAGGIDLLVAKLPADGTGDGTYGGLVYQDAVLTDADAVLTENTPTLSDAAASLTDDTAVLTDADAVLTSEFFKITP